MGVFLTALVLPKFVFANVWQAFGGARATEPVAGLLYPPVDLSYFDTPIGWRA